MICLAAHAHDLSELGVFGWLAVLGAGVAVIWVVWMAVKLTLDPREDDPNHVKYSILQDDPPPAPARPADENPPPGD